MKMRHALSLAGCVVLLGAAACDRDDEVGMGEGVEFEQRQGPLVEPEVEREQEPLAEQEPAIGEENELTQETTPIGGTENAMEAIATARCQQEMRCGDIGQGEEYASEQACRSQVREEWRDELSAFECPAGVVPEELNDCLSEIRDRECGDPLDTLGRIVACQSVDICKDMTAR